jgi:BirA family biotin operon repressor/biotin-[acetyl-CoA-carboxylase] ligase
MTELLEPTSIGADLRTATLPQTIRCYEAVESTMDVARGLLPALDDTELPLLVTAEVQTAGRGRMGRRWEAAPGSALMLSLALRPTWLRPERGVALVWMAAVALCEAVEEVAPLRAALKWPNDLMLPVASNDGGPTTDHGQKGEDRHGGAAEQSSLIRRPSPPYAKAAGILLEVGIGGQGFEWAILGCGVNVSDSPPEGTTRYPATHLERVAGSQVSRLTLLRMLLRRLDHWYVRLLEGDEHALFAAWRARLVTIGQRVRVETSGGVVDGIAEAVDSGGALLVRDDAGTLQTITAGDVGLAP